MHFAVDHWWSNQVQPLHHVRGSVSEGTTSCTCRTLPEQNSSIRCWTAANACSAELCRYLACTVSLSRLTHLASNSSVTIKMYCRGSTLNHQFNQMLRYHARSVGSGTTESVRATRGSTTQDGNRRNTWMLCYVVSFLMARYRTATKACCDHKSREYALSLCGVTFRDTLCAPRASFTRTYHHNQRVVCLRLCRQRVKHQSQREAWP